MHFLPRPPQSLFLWTVVALQVLFFLLGSCFTAALPPGSPPEGSRQEQSRLCDCSRACFALLQLRLSGFPFWTEIVWCLSSTLTLPSQTSPPSRSLGPCQPPLCRSLLPGPPSEPQTNLGCLHVLLGGFAFKSELLVVEKMPLCVLGCLRQPRQGCCQRQK